MTQSGHSDRLLRHKLNRARRITIDRGHEAIRLLALGKFVARSRHDSDELQYPLSGRYWGISGSVTDIVELTCGPSSSVLEVQITKRSSHEIQVYRRAAGGIQTHWRKRWAFHGGPANARRVSRRRSEVSNKERAGALRADRTGM